MTETIPDTYITDPENAWDTAHAEKIERESMFNGTLRGVRSEDLVALRPILEHWIRDGDTGKLLTEEVNGVLSAIEASIDGSTDKSYVTAEDSEGKVVGVMGMTAPGEEMQHYAKSEKPAELINAFVNP